MKFKFSPEKFNLLLMIFMLIVLVFNVVVWLIFREYIYFAIFLVLTIMITHMYFRTRYVLDDKYFITYLGFLKIKINYNKIKKVELKNNKNNIKLNYFTIDVSPDNKDKFLKEIKKKIKECK